MSKIYSFIKADENNKEKIRSTLDQLLPSPEVQWMLKADIYNFWVTIPRRFNHILKIVKYQTVKYGTDWLMTAKFTSRINYFSYGILVNPDEIIIVSDMYVSEDYDYVPEIDAYVNEKPQLKKLKC